MSREDPTKTWILTGQQLPGEHTEHLGPRRRGVLLNDGAPADCRRLIADGMPCRPVHFLGSPFEHSSFGRD